MLNYTDIAAVFFRASVCYHLHGTIQFVHLSSSPFHYSPSFIFLLKSPTIHCFCGPEGKAASGIGIPLIYTDRAAVFL